MASPYTNIRLEGTFRNLHASYNRNLAIIGGRKLSETGLENPEDIS